MIEFRKPVLEDKTLIENYIHQQNSRSCECTFANIYLWHRFYKVEYAIVEDTLVFKTVGDNPSFVFPMGQKEHVKAAIDALMAYCDGIGKEYRMHIVTPEQFALLEEWYPDTFQIEYMRDSADYVYEAEKLRNLSGRKYHGKKNHVNKFKKVYPEWSYESISDENVEECFQMALKWRNENGCEDDEEKIAEICVTLNALRLFKELELRGGLLRADGEIVAFSIGEPVTPDTFVVHIEKAFADVPGAYPMINQQFVIHETEGFTYINREEDLGEEGLRQAKNSYHPVFLVEKGIVTRKGGR